jgi:PhnB protein
MASQSSSQFHTVSPILVMRDSSRAIEFYEKAFGAAEQLRLRSPDGKIIHAQIKIGDSVVMLTDESPMGHAHSPETLQGSTVILHLSVPDVDAFVAKAVAAGAALKMPVTDMFWGDRYGQLADPFGYLWSVSTHKKDLTPEEQQRRTLEFYEQLAAGNKR